MMQPPTWPPRVLVEAVAAWALPLAREHANVERIATFVSEGGQTRRDETFERIFVPTLLVASGRTAEAPAALADYQECITPGSDEAGG